MRGRAVVSCYGYHKRLSKEIGGGKGRKLSAVTPA